MDKYKIKKLAQMTIIDGKVNKNVCDFVLNKLSKKDIKIYLFYLKNELKKNKIYVIISSVPSESTREAISKMFDIKEIDFKVDQSLGGGLRIEYNDNIIDMSVKNLINQSINKVINNL